MKGDVTTLLNDKEVASAQRSIQSKNDSVWVRFFRQWDFQLMILPSLAFIIVFSYIPMWGVMISFKDYNLFTGFSASPWVGFVHFKMFFESPEFWTIVTVLGYKRKCVVPEKVNAVRH